MLTALRLLAVVFVLLVCQATWTPRIAIAGIAPDLFVALVFWIAVRRGMHWGVWLGLAVGLLLDVEQPQQLGMNAFALALAGLVIGRGSTQLDKGNPFVAGALLFAGALAAESARVVWLAASGVGDPPLAWLRYALPGALYTALAIPPLSLALARLFGRKDWILGAA